jgi:hypothetical protein
MFLSSFLMIFSGCGANKHTVKELEPQKIPSAYTSKIQDCDWDGDKTYQGLVNYVKKVQHCLKEYEHRITKIVEWERDQQEAVQKKKKKLGIE